MPSNPTPQAASRSGGPPPSSGSTQTKSGDSASHPACGVDPLPDAVKQFRAQIEAADGVVISSPEYNHGIPGVLKNALDWASRPHNSSPLKDKPVLIMTSSVAFTGGVRAQYQIRETLAAALARPVITAEVIVGNIACKIIDGVFVDAATVAFAQAAVTQMIRESALTESKNLAWNVHVNT